MWKHDRGEYASARPERRKTQLALPGSRLTLLPLLRRRWAERLALPLRHRHPLPVYEIFEVAFL